MTKQLVFETSESEDRMNEKGQGQDSLSKKCKVIGLHRASWDRHDEKTVLSVLNAAPNF